jgi:hypothetical protein
MAAYKKIRKRKKATRAPHLLPEARGKTIEEFCRVYGLTRGTFYRWKDNGRAPALLNPSGEPKGWQIITAEAEHEWRQKFSKKTAAAADDAPADAAVACTAAE